MSIRLRCLSGVWRTLPFSTLGLEAGSKCRLSCQSEGQARPQCNLNLNLNNTLFTQMGITTRRRVILL